jgi:hypothetical protein
MHRLTKLSPSNRVLRFFLFGLLLGLILVIAGWILIPTTSLLSIAGICLILVAYGFVGYFVIPRIQPPTLRLVALSGLLAGLIFAGEILLEYAFLPADNTSWGLVEFGSVLALFFLTSLWAAYKTRSIREGTLAAILSAMLSSIIWLVILLLTFYLFRGTSRQALVFTAEGDFEDFARSGMKDFNTFMMEDFLGAGFFHLLLLPLLAAILGWIGSLLGKNIPSRKH